MQILMTKAAHDRVAEQLTAIAPDAEFITIVSPEAYERDGAPIATEVVRPEVVWLSMDSGPAGGLREAQMKHVMTAPSVRWVQVLAAGIEDPTFRGIVEKGIRLTKGGAQATPIAEYVVAHALSLQVPIEAQRALQAKHEWKWTHYRELGRTRWLLVGWGNIGHEIAKRIKPFGVDLTVVRRSPAPDPLADRVVSQAEMASVLPEADVVVLACGLTDETRGMADAAFFKALKPGAILINIGRGGLVDEDALRAGLDRDQPAHAVLDVFATEPLPAHSWFWDHPKVRVSAHTSWSGDGNGPRGDELFLENLRRYVAGKPLLNEASRHEVGL
jgi:phosphoglycerate dehydrogenase-like enzyme